MINKKLIFRSSGYYFAIDAGYLSEVIKHPEYIEIPNKPEYLTGYAVNSGEVVPLIDIAVKTGNGVTQKIREFIVIFDIGGEKIGVETDEIVRFEKLSDREFLHEKGNIRVWKAGESADIGIIYNAADIFAAVEAENG